MQFAICPPDMTIARASDHYVLDNLIERMWDIRDRLAASPKDHSLEQQWMFIRRVVARSLVHHRQSSAGA